MRVSMESAELKALLKRAELFSNLLDDDLAYVADRVELVSLKPREILFDKGEKAWRFFIVRSGEIGIFRSEEGES